MSRNRIRAAAPAALITILAGLAAFSAHVLADSYSGPEGVPRLVPFRGQLERDGANVSSAVNISFEIYDAASGGLRLWGPEAHNITPRNGAFSAMLGSTVTLPSSVLAGGDAWVAVTVDGVLLSSRQRLASSPYALRSADADRARIVTTPLTSANVADGSLAGADLAPGTITEAQISSTARLDLGVQTVSCASVYNCDCPAGTRVIAGGVDCNWTGRALYQSTPTGTGWHGTCCSLPSGPCEVPARVWSICARIQ